MMRELPERVDSGNPEMPLIFPRIFKKNPGQRDE
jgi:hypothetical protein